MDCLEKIVIPLILGILGSATTIFVTLVILFPQETKRKLVWYIKRVTISIRWWQRFLPYSRYLGLLTDIPNPYPYWAAGYQMEMDDLKNKHRITYIKKDL